ncbi:efflux transporter outer membrane subunit [Silvimonas iriomotensis]|uniref:RND transporter n=1 Tax=Silvimonas iriomotensis TaxID=449662 RepID=A0ABQ2PAW8_9NEIS|nr:TolC family protein [Silvimonas iriomotensis]GGP22317.1 RND transporter [Silvimonas iriomotensis]
MTGIVARFARRGGLLLVVIGLSACTVVGPDYVRPAAEIAPDWHSGSLALAPQQQADMAQWWQHFNDPVLNGLIEEALRKNHSGKVAALRVMEARAQLAIAGSNLYPQVQQATGSALYTATRPSGGATSSQISYSVGLNAGWELDFWGRFQRGIEAADASYLASLDSYDDVRILLVTQTATVYAAIRTLESRLQIVHANADIQKRSLEITTHLFQSGNESELDLQQAKTQYLSTVASIPALEASLRTTQNALAGLLARPPGPLPEMASGTGAIPQAGLLMVADLPADLLRRRPDVRVAEMQLIAQSSLIGVAQADLYPSLTLLGSLGVSATSVAGSPTVATLGLGPSLTWNIFDYGRITNNVRVQDARFQALAELYQDSVLQAAREVDDAAVSYAKSLEQIALLNEGEIAARRALAIANIQYREGMADFERVLDAQRALFSQQERVVTNQGDVVANLIAVYKAMGGAWQVARPQPLLDDATLKTMKERTSWGDLLDAPLPASDQDFMTGKP